MEGVGSYSCATRFSNTQTFSIATVTRGRRLWRKFKGNTPSCGIWGIHGNTAGIRVLTIVRILSAYQL